MKLIFRSTLRHIKSHLLQTVLTFLATTFVVAMMSVLFNFVSSFQSLLRNFALEQTGSYHYRYLVPTNTPSEDMLREMAAEFQDDEWFSDVVLNSREDQLEMVLTVASPGIFTSSVMEQKFTEYTTEYQQQHHCELITYSEPNYELLVSYGDISKKNGMYAYLLIFFFLFGIIAATSMFTLGAVFQVSVSQRRHDFALFLSIGADRSHLKKMVLTESAFYMAAIPFGYLLGIAFFIMMKSRIDVLLQCLEKFPEIQLVISFPVTVILFLCVSGIILISSIRPAASTMAISPMEIFRGTREVHISKKERLSEITFSKKISAERWLARKSHRRFGKRFRPIHLVMSLALILCFTLAAFWQYSANVTDMTYKEQDYNICVDLYSDNQTNLEQFAEKLMIQSERELCEVREARFELREPYPLSELGRSAHFLESSAGLPDVMLVSLDNDRYRDICRDLGCATANNNEFTGIFINTANVWRWDGISYYGNPFELKEGEDVKIYQSIDTEQIENGISITIAGILDEAPKYVDTNLASRMVLLVSRETLMQLQPLRPFADSEPGMYHISVRGNAADTYGIEHIVKEIGSMQDSVCYDITNYEKSIQQSYAGIAGFRYICMVLIILLVLICICGNFTVSWTIHHSRKKEFAMLVSIGMEPARLQKMRNYELLYYLRSILVIGIPIGFVCDWCILKIYSSEYALNWQFPWEGLLFGLFVLCLSLILSETAQRIHMKNLSITDMLRSE